MVLFLFVIMLISIERAEKERQFNKQWLVGIVAAAALGGLFIAVYTTRTKGILFPEGRMTYGEGQKHAGRSRHCSSTAMRDSTCSPSRSHRCCCWWRSSEQW